MMAQYSSQVQYIGGGAKRPSKSISMKFLVLALIAQIRAGAGS